MATDLVNQTEDNYRKDSYSDRICDDLSEVILQFLPFEDKLRLEYVSKVPQFQRTILERHYDLIFDETLEMAIEMNKVNLEALLQKIPNIKFLTSKRFASTKTTILKESDIYVLIENLNNLIEINCNFYKMSDQLRERFAQKFGPKVTSYLAKPYDIPMIAKYFPNIVCLSPMNFHGSPMTPDQLNGLVLNNLKKVSLRFNEPEFADNFKEELKSFKEVIESHKRLTHLRLDLFGKTDKYFEFVFKQISELKDLIELEIKFSNEIPDKYLANGLKQLSQNCLKIKSLKFEFIQIEDNAKDLYFAKELPKFKHLRRLLIVFQDSPLTSPDFDPFKALNDSLKALQNLTHLDINFLFGVPISQTLLTDIDKYLPKLQELRIYWEMNANKETANILSRLLSLKVLVLYLSESVEPSIAEIIKSKVLENCKRIVSVSVVLPNPLDQFI